MSASLASRKLPAKYSILHSIVTGCILYVPIKKYDTFLPVSDSWRIPTACYWSKRRIINDIRTQVYKVYCRLDPFSLSFFWANTSRFIMIARGHFSEGRDWGDWDWRYKNRGKNTSFILIFFISSLNLMIWQKLKAKVRERGKPQGPKFWRVFWRLRFR